jgi:hypothetical protein
MIEKVVGGYLVAALIVSLLVLTLNKKTLKRMKNWQILLFFVLSPILVIREFLKN